MFEENYNNKLENYVLEYLKQAYGMQLKATSYFEIEYQRYSPVENAVFLQKKRAFFNN